MKHETKSVDIMKLLKVCKFGGFTNQLRFIFKRHLKVLYAFMDEFYREFGVNPGRSGYDLCMETGTLVDQTRRELTTFFNGDNPDRLFL